MRHTSKLGFTLVELLVVIAIIGTLVGLLLPAVNAAREAARSNTCRNNLIQLQKGLAQRESSLGDFPGYINNLGVKGTQNQIRASWVVFTFPYIEQNALWDLWSQPNGGANPQDFVIPQNIPALEILICPSDPPVIPTQPNLSYAANAGWLWRSHSLLSSAPIPAESPSANNTNQENPANGVFFDRSRTAAVLTPNLVGPDDVFDTNGIPAPIMTMAYIQQKGDGASSTILLTENIHQVAWAHNVPDEYTSSGTSDEKFHFGVCWEQPDVIVNTSATDDEKARRINGDTSEDSYTLVTEMALDEDDVDSDPDLRKTLPSSRHPGGINVAFVGGTVRFVGDQIEPRIYAQLMTSNRKKSDLVFAGQSEANLPPISDSDY